MLEFIVKEGNNYDEFTKTTFVTDHYMAVHPTSLRQRLTEINVYFGKNKCNTAAYITYFLDGGWSSQEPCSVDKNSEFSRNTFKSIWKRHLHGDLNPWPFHFARVFLIIKPSSCTNPSVMGGSITVPGPQISACMVSQYLLGLNIPPGSKPLFISLCCWCGLASSNIIMLPLLLSEAVKCRIVYNSWHFSCCSRFISPTVLVSLWKMVSDWAESLTCLISSCF